MEILHVPPSLGSFTPLTTHQSQTPSSFYEGPPVLHHHTHDAQLVISAHDLNSTPALSNLRASTSPPIPNGHTDANADREQTPDIVLRGLDICVTSERFIIFSPRANHGLAIPYPSISLHAIQRLHLPSQHSSSESEVQGLFMQLSTSDGFDDHDVDATVSLTIVPAQQAQPAALSVSSTTTTSAAAVAVEEQEGTATSSSTTTTTTTTPEIQALFAAVTSCSNLHPDAIDQDGDIGDDDAGMIYADSYGDGEIYGESEGYSYVDGGATGLPPPMPGSGGWITAENVGQFFDGEGNWRGAAGAGSGRLGVRAGVVRGREEGEDEGRGDGNEKGGGEGEGQGEETKWRRTG